MHATSLNYRDLGVREGRFSYPGEQLPLIPLCDGAGEVVEVGKSTIGFQPGDRVVANYFPDWADGLPTPEKTERALGGSTDGMLAEYVTVPARALVKLPDSLSYEEAAALPCAAVTAWNALVFRGKIKAGDTVLTLGTGGVSTYALQFAKLHGATVISTSSSNDKLDKVRQLGADYTINYREHPDWEKQVLDYTQGRGVDHVVEVGGAGTLNKSLASVRDGGMVALIGVLANASDPPSLMSINTRSVTVQGIYVGSTQMFEEMVRAMDAGGVKPVIDRTFAFEEAPQAYDYMESASHLGKIVITI